MIRFKNKKFAFLLTVTPILLLSQLVICVIIFSYIVKINNAENQSKLVDDYMRYNIRYVTVAESGQRGYLLTHDSNYLKPYFSALEELEKNEQVYDSLFNGIEIENLKHVRTLSQVKLNELATTINLHNEGKIDSAISVVKSGYGSNIMDTLRDETHVIRGALSSSIATMQKREFMLIYVLLSLIIALIVFNIFFSIYKYNWVINNAQKLELSIEELEKANRQLNDYTNMSYHELKTPLRSITGFLQLLRKKYGHQMDGEAVEFVGYITDGVVQMNSTINSLRKQHLDKE
ncbi:MAG: CHASE3 domain-containing protein [Bacteroidetes bacterium]|nr:CHASE3 domain-containing protein [Bacteroidota bacterium]